MKVWFIILAICFPGFLTAQNMKLKVTVGNQVFTATLNNSETAKEFLKLLPMTVSMNEHNGNEKFCSLPQRMTGQATNPGRIQAGDLMIWSSTTLVLFYDSFSAGYSYIRLGQIDNASGLKEAVGRGSIRVKYELQV